MKKSKGDTGQKKRDLKKGEVRIEEEKGEEERIQKRERLKGEVKNSKAKNRSEEVRGDEDMRKKKEVDKLCVRRFEK